MIQDCARKHEGEHIEKKVFGSCEGQPDGIDAGWAGNIDTKKEQGHREYLRGKSERNCLRDKKRECNEQYTGDDRTNCKTIVNARQVQIGSYP